LLATVEQDAVCEVHVDLEATTIRAGAREAAIAIPAELRAGFLSGTWDPLSQLLERYEDVEAVAARLGYPDLHSGR
jgi:hypothetical protein